MSLPVPRGARDLVASSGYVALTDRLLALTGRAGLVVAAFASLPFVHLVAFWAALVATGASTDGPDSLLGAVPSRLMNVYLVLLGFWGARRIAGQLAVVQGAIPTEADGSATWRTWLLPPVVLSLAFAAVNEVSHGLEYGTAFMVENPLPFVVSAGLAILIRIPQMTAFWTVVVALLATARLGRVGQLGTFPEDRSLGLQPVGEMVFQVFVLLVAAFVPVFALSSRPADLVASATLFAVAVYAVVLAVWHLHRRMVEVRRAAIVRTRSRYAAAYRAAAAERPGKGVGDELRTAETLVRGAESIQEWPFDERMQRLATIIATGVVTGIVVRLILLALGV